MRRMGVLVVNAVTLARVPLALMCVVYLLQKEWTLAWLCFLTSVATDVIDGPLARRLKAETPFGKTADVASDVAIFWILLGGAALYVWRYHQPSGADLLKYSVGAFGTIIAVFVGTMNYHGKIFLWWRTKGNFWCGVIPDAIIGLWISWQAGPWALATTVAYGIAAVYYNATKVRQFI